MYEVIFDEDECIREVQIQCKCSTPSGHPTAPSCNLSWPLLPAGLLLSSLLQRSITNPKQEPHLVLIYSEVRIDPQRTGHLVFPPVSPPFPYFSSLSRVKEVVFFPKDYNVLRRKGCLCADFTFPSSTHTNTEGKEKGIVNMLRVRSFR